MKWMVKKSLINASIFAGRSSQWSLDPDPCLHVCLVIHPFAANVSMAIFTSRSAAGGTAVHVSPGRTAAPHLPRPSEVGGGIEKGGGSGVGNTGRSWDHRI